MNINKGPGGGWCRSSEETLQITVNEVVFSYLAEAGLEAGLHPDPPYVWAEEAVGEKHEEGEGANRHKVLTTGAPGMSPSLTRSH